MRLTLVTGGARSGKSHWAEAEARRLADGAAVTFVATAEAGDDDMAERIRRHRAERPGGWRTLEAPRAAGAAVAAAGTPIVLLDCLTLLASNALLAEGEAAVRVEVDALLAVRAARDGHLIVVTNEVGMGVVPATALGRAFRDALGGANRQVAAAADDVVLLVSGIPLVVKGALPLLGTDRAV